MTLVEVMIASGLLFMFIAAATGVLVATATALSQVRQRTTAAALAWSRIERARFMDFSLLPELEETTPGTRIDANGLLNIDGRFLRTTTLTFSTNALSMANIRVQVWPMGRNGTFEQSPEVVETVITAIERAGADL